MSRMDDDNGVIDDSDDEFIYSSDLLKGVKNTEFFLKDDDDFLDSQFPESPEQKNSNDLEVISVSDSDSDSVVAQQIKNVQYGKLKRKKIVKTAIKQNPVNSALCGQHDVKLQTPSQIKNSAKRGKRKKSCGNQRLNSHDKNLKQTKLDAFKKDSPRLSLDSGPSFSTKLHKKGENCVIEKQAKDSKDVKSTKKPVSSQNKILVKRATSPDTIKLFSSSTDSTEEAIEEIDSRSDSDVSLSEYEGKKIPPKRKKGSNEQILCNSKPAIKESASKAILQKLKSEKTSNLVMKVLHGRQSSSPSSSRLSLCKRKRGQKKMKTSQNDSEEDLTQKLSLDPLDDNHSKPRSQSPNIFSGSDTEIVPCLYNDATLPYVHQTTDKDTSIAYMNKTIDKDATLPYMEVTMEKSSPSESDSYTDDNVPLQTSINKIARDCKNNSSSCDLENKARNVINQMSCDLKMNLEKLKKQSCDPKDNLEKVKKQSSSDLKMNLDKEKKQSYNPKHILEKLKKKSCDLKNSLEKAKKQSSRNLENNSQKELALYDLRNKSKTEKTRSIDFETKSDKEKESKTVSMPNTDDESTQEPDYSLIYKSNPDNVKTLYSSLDLQSKLSPELSSDDSMDLPNCDFLTQPFNGSDNSKHVSGPENKQGTETSKDKSDLLDCSSGSKAKLFETLTTSKNIESEKDMSESMKRATYAKSSKNTEMQVESEDETKGVNMPSTSSNKAQVESSMPSQENDEDQINNDPSPIFRRSKPINLTESLPWVSFTPLTVPKKTTASKIYSPSSSIFEKMAFSSQALLKGSQVEDEHQVTDKEMMPIPILNITTPDKHSPEEAIRVTEKELNIGDFIKDSKNSKEVDEVSNNDIQKIVTKIKKKDDNSIYNTASGLGEAEIPMLVKDIKKEKDVVNDENIKKDTACSELPIAVSDIKKEKEFAFSYTQDDDDVIDVFDSDDEEALFAMSQVQVSFKAEPFSDDDTVEDDLSAMGELYLKNLTEDNLEPRTKVLKLEDSNFTSKRSEPLTVNVDFFHEYYMKDNRNNQPKESHSHHEAITATKRVTRPSTPIDSQLDHSDCDDELLSHIAEIECNLNLDNDKKPFQNPDETSNQKQVDGNRVEIHDKASKDKDEGSSDDIFNLFSDSDSDATVGDDECYNEATLLEDDDEVLNESMKKLDSFQCYDQSTIMSEEGGDDSKELQTATEHNNNLEDQPTTSKEKSDSFTTLHLDKIRETDTVSKPHSSFETGSDEELFNLMSEASGIQSPGKIISYSPNLKSKISDKLVSDNKSPPISDAMVCDKKSGDKEITRDEESMDESDTEPYFAATQKVSDQESEDDFDYDFGTQAVETPNKSMSTKTFYSSHSKSLNKRDQKHILQIEPRKQESRREIRNKYKNTKEVQKKKTEQKQKLPSISTSKAILNSYKQTYASKTPSSCKTPSSSTSTISAPLKNAYKSNWMNSVKQKNFSTQNKPAKKKRKKANDDDAFSFTQTIGKAREQMKQRKTMSDVPKLSIAKFTKSRHEEAMYMDTCSDVELPNMSQIIGNQLPIITCDVNEMKRKREIQRKEELNQKVEKEKMTTENNSTNSSKDDSKVSKPSSSSSSGASGTFVKPKSSSSRSTSEKSKHGSSSSKNSSKVNNIKRSLCVDKVNENRKVNSKDNEDKVSSRSSSGSTVSTKKTVPDTKGVSVVDPSEKGGNRPMILDDLFSKLGPIDKPTHLPFQMKVKPNPHVLTSKASKDADSSCSTALPSSSGKSIIDETLIRKANDAFKTFDKDKSATSIQSETNSLYRPIGGSNEAKSSTVSDNQRSNDVSNQSRVHSDVSNQLKVNNMSNQSSSNNISNIGTRDPRNARRDPRVLGASDTLRANNQPTNLMLKPTSTMRSNANKENKMDNVNRLFTDQDYFKLILKWNPVWLEEQAKQSHSKNIEMPPVLGKNKVFPLLESYSNVQDYQEILLNLMVLETWEMIYRDWKERHDKKRAVIFNIGLEKIAQADNDFITLMWQSILPEGSYRSGKYPREGDLVRLDVWGASIDKARMKDGQTPKGMWLPQMGYVERVIITENQHLDTLLGRVKSLSKDPLCKGRKVTSLRIVTKLNYRKFSPIGTILMKLEVLSSLVTNMRQASALAYLPRSCLSKELIKPGNERVYVHPVVPSPSKELRNEFDVSQSEAIKSICLAIQQPDIVPKVCILQGPPGTGKSHTIVGLINSIIKSSTNKMCICLATPSNAAADELMRRLKKDKVKRRHQNDSNSIKIVRIGNVDNMHPDVKDCCWDVLYAANREKELKEKQRRNIPDSVKDQLITLEKRIEHLKQEKFKLQTGQQNLMVDKSQIDLNKLIKKHRNLEKQSLNSINQHEKLTRSEEYELRKGILLKADVICGTLSSFGNLKVLDTLKKVTNNQRKPFNCLIIDEASQAAEIDCLIPLQYGMSKIILVGDPEQLPATVLSQKAGEMNFGQSLLERLYNYFHHNNPRAVIMLKTQYRMDKDIFSFPNRLVYNGQLNTHPSVDHTCQKFPLKPYIVFDMACGKELVQGSAICNMVEAKSTVELCSLLSRKVQPSYIGVICPYQSQKALVLEGLRVQKLEKVEVGTVDGFQGREKLVIILTCVRAQSLSGGIGFLADRRRMNVALTRAKNALYILGHLPTLQKNADWKLLIDDAVKRKAVIRVDNPTQFTQAAKVCFKHSS